jgi:hypothetical protein
LNLLAGETACLTLLEVLNLLAGETACPTLPEF